MEIRSNKVTLVGKIFSELTYSHRAYGESFYKGFIEVYRTSGTADVLPFLVSDRLIDVHKDYSDRVVEVNGQFRSYNQRDEENSKLMLAVFVREICFLEEVKDYTNEIFLDGYICKAPVHRRTPLGREIADILLAVNRPYGKSDYIPCIAWGRNARWIWSFDVGAHIRVTGRIQSREYVKKLSETKSEIRMAYEVSASRLEEVINEKSNA